MKSQILFCPKKTSRPFFVVMGTLLVSASLAVITESKSFADTASQTEPLVSFSSHNLLNPTGYCAPETNVVFDYSRPDSLSNMYLSAAVSGLAYEKNASFRKQQLTNWGFIKNTDLLKDKSGFRAFVAEHQNFILIGFRGTKTAADIFANGQFFQKDFETGSGVVGAKAHIGMIKIYRNLEKPLRRALDQMGGKSKPLYLAGHSLGGALASLFTYRLFLDGYQILGMNSVGQPKFGNEVLHEAINAAVGEHLYLLSNTSDITPLVPPERDAATDFSDIIASKHQKARTAVKNLVEELDYTQNPGNHFLMSIGRNTGLSAIYRGQNITSRENDYWQKVSETLEQRSDIVTLVEFLTTRITSHFTHKYLCGISSYLNKSEKI